MKLCAVCSDEHRRDDDLCARCREFADYWHALSPEQQRREQRMMDDYADDVAHAYRGDG